MDITEILSELIKAVPVIAVLIWFIYHYQKQGKAKDEKIEELYAKIKENEKESVKVLYKVTATLDKVIESDKSQNELLRQSIESLKEVIITKLDGFKNNEDEQS